MAPAETHQNRLLSAGSPWALGAGSGRERSRGILGKELRERADLQTGKQMHQPAQNCRA